MGNQVCILHDGDLTAFLESCKDASGPLNEEHDACVYDINYDPQCYNYRESGCQFTGDKIADVGNVQDAATCEAFCELQSGIGCQFFSYSAINNYCQLYSTLEHTCNIEIG